MPAPGLLLSSLNLAPSLPITPFMHTEMILTPIPRARLGDALDRVAARLDDRAAAAAFARIRATAPDRARGAEAERHRQAAIEIARRRGIRIHPAGTACRFNWDGRALDGDTEAYVILHEVAHWLLASPARRRLVDFGLGPGPDTRDRGAAEQAALLPPLARERDEAVASLLGILWEAALGQPALASFLDQNWLEGLDRTAAPHFTAVLAELTRRGFVDASGGVRLRRCASPGRSGRGSAACGRAAG
jgi:hypothetical protein